MLSDVDKDSLLLERADAERSCEISQVNEMLAWMESHELPAACTTNNAERLERASLRRCAFRRLQPSIPIEVSHLFRSKLAGHSDDPSRVAMRVASG